MSEEAIAWTPWADMPEPWATMQTMVYTECGMTRNQTWTRVMLRVADDPPIELFRVPARVQVDMATGLCRSVFSADWYAAMQDSAAKYFALRALQEPL